MLVCVSVWTTSIKGAVSRYSVIFCAFFARPKNGGCSRKCRGHHLKAWPSARPGSLATCAGCWHDSVVNQRQVEPELHCFTCRRRLAALLFSGYEARARSYPLLQGSRLAATAISIDSLFGFLVLRAFRSLLRRSRRREHGWLGEGFGSVVVAPFPVTLTMCVTVKANALNEERVWGTDVDVRANTGFVVAFAQYVTKTWRLKKRTCGKLRGRPARRQRTFEGDAQGPCMSSVNFFLPERRTFEHCTSCCPSRDATMVVLTKKKKTPNAAYHSTKKIFWGSVPTLEARCSLKSAVWRRIEWVHKSAKDKTTTWPPDAGSAWKVASTSLATIGARSSFSGARLAHDGMNFRDLSWWPPLFFPTQNG